MDYYIEKTCESCGDPFTDKSKNHNGKYCSRKCNMSVCNKTYPTTITGRYNTAKKELTRSRNKNKKQWLLSLEEYTSIIKDNSCYYCKGELPLYGVALDRIDNNNKNYEISNVLPCCLRCNRLRGDSLTVDETIYIIKTLKQLRNKENVWG